MVQHESNLEILWLCEISQIQRPHIRWVHFFEMPKTGESIETKADWQLPPAGDPGLWSDDFENEVSFWGEVNVLELVTFIAKLCEQTKTHHIVFNCTSKYVQLSHFF
jgi:hypothetical protein